MAHKKSWAWLDNICKVIFVLLGINTCLLLLILLPPFWGLDSLFAREKVPILDQQIPVQQEAGLLFGNVEIACAENLSLQAARLYINGLEVGNFATGTILTRVYEGDLLRVDGSAYKREIAFEIRAISSNIDQSLLPQQITTNGNGVDLPAIRFK